MAQVEQIRHFLSAGAWTEAALALVRVQAPDWTVRRIELDDGEWFCSLSRYPAMPLDSDDSLEGRHRLLPLAILAALAQAREHAPSPADPSPSLQSSSASSGAPAWLDNFR